MSATDTKLGPYINAALKEEISSLAALMERSFSKEAAWLIKLGLRCTHLLPKRVPRALEGEGDRQWLYPSEVVYDQLSDLLDSLRLKTGNHWSMSALCRELIKVGVRIEWWVAQSLERGAARLSVHQAEAEPDATTHTLALTMCLKHTAVELLVMREGGPTDATLKTWNTDALNWTTAIDAALDARMHIDRLKEGL